MAVSQALQGHLAAIFLVKHFPVPNLLSDFGLGLLCSIMPWKWAAKLWLCCYLALSFFACLRFTTLLPRRSMHVYWLAPTIVVLNLCFWWGFLNFQLSVILMLLFSYYLLKGDAKPVPLAALLVLVFLSHAIALAVCAVALLVYSVAHKTHRLLLVFLPTGLLAGWYVYGRFMSTGNPEGLILSDVPVPYWSRAFAVYKLNTYFKSLGYVNPKVGVLPMASSLFGSSALYVLVVCVGALGIALLYLMWVSAYKSFREQAPERFLWLTVGLVFLAALCCPSKALGISDPGSRFMVCGLALGVLLLRENSHVAKLACVVCVGIGVAGVVMFAVVAFQRRDKSWSGAGNPPASIAAFAHVEPELRAYYYHSLQSEDMTKPVFGTSLLYNRQALPASSRAAAAMGAVSQK